MKCTLNARAMCLIDNPPAACYNLLARGRVWSNICRGEHGLRPALLALTTAEGANLRWRRRNSQANRLRATVPLKHWLPARNRHPDRGSTLMLPCLFYLPITLSPDPSPVIERGENRQGEWVYNLQLAITLSPNPSLNDGRREKAARESTINNLQSTIRNGGKQVWL